MKIKKPIAKLKPGEIILGKRKPDSRKKSIKKRK